MWICVDLRDGVVTGLLRLDSLVGNFNVWRRHSLKLSLLVDVLIDVVLPVPVLLPLRKEHLVGPGLHQLGLASRNMLNG